MLSRQTEVGKQRMKRSTSLLIRTFFNVGLIFWRANRFSKSADYQTRRRLLWVGSQWGREKPLEHGRNRRGGKMHQNCAF